MDFVYLCGPIRTDELRYSIRSVVKNFENADNVWLVGEPPAWFNGQSIIVEQRRADNYNNARKNLTAIADSDQISDQFILMNDDFFIVDKIDSIPVYHGGLLVDRVRQYQQIAPHSSYTQMLNETYYWLVHHGIKDPLDYELHVPMVMSKSKLRDTIIPGVLWRSLYGNLNEVGGTKINDVKYYSSPEFNSKTYDYMSGATPFVSTDDQSFSQVKVDLLDPMFDSPSKYESI